MSSGDVRDAETRLVLARAPQDDVEGRRMRSSVQAALFGGHVEPIKIDRYVILERLGTGGVGTVYAAYDPQLDRRVALKLLKAQGTSPGSTEEAKENLRREAQAMAQLSHPNVITVYDVGEFGDDEVFISMELIEGQTLSQWMRAEVRAWPQVVEVFMEAGRGLEAAHAVGLVHLDFKPANVLVGKDGRVRVLDFGLARVAEPDSPVRDEILTGDSSVSMALLTDSVVGTPAYMAPEQHIGSTRDERTDQYSYCVALYEALWGQRPFRGVNPKELGEAKLEERFELPSRGVPAWLRRIVGRGLAADPTARHGSMSALLSALSWGKRRRRRIGIGALAGGLVVAAALAVFLPTPSATCEAEVEALAGQWDEGVRSRIESAFSGTGLDYAELTANRVVRGLDARAQAWREARVELCEQQRAGAVDATDFLERRICLDQKLKELAQLSSLMERADETVVPRALDAMDALPAATDCGPNLGPSGDLDAQAHADLRLQLTRANTLRAAGKYAEGLVLTRSVHGAAVAGGSPVLERTAVVLEGRLLDDMGDVEAAEETLLRGLAAAEAAEDDTLALEAMIELVYVIGVSRGRPREGLRWGSLAMAKVERAGGRDEKSRLLDHLGILYKDTGELERARQVLETSVRLREEVGASTSMLASSLNNLGSVYMEEGKFGAARAHFQRAVALTIESVGPDHPDVASPQGNEAVALLRLEHWDEAEALLRKSAALHERVFGPDSQRLALVHNNLASAYIHQERWEEASAAITEALRISEKAYEPGHSFLAYIHGTAAEVAERRGDLEAALEHGRAALAIFERTVGPDDERTQELRAFVVELEAHASGAETSASSGPVVGD